MRNSPKECTKPTPVHPDGPEPTSQTSAEPVYPAEREERADSGINVLGETEQAPTTEDPVPETPPRRTKRKTAGKHRNKFK